MTQYQELNCDWSLLLKNWPEGSLSKSFQQCLGAAEPQTTRSLLKLAEILAGCGKVSSDSVNTAFGMARGTSVIPLIGALVFKIGWRVKQITLWGCLTTNINMSVSFQEILKTFFLWKINFMLFCQSVPGFRLPSHRLR